MLLRHYRRVWEKLEGFITKENLVTEDLVPLEFTQVVERMFPKWKGYFRRNDRGQDLAEYCLITAVIALIGLGLFINISGGLQNLWGGVNSTIAAGGSVTPAESQVSGNSGEDHGSHGGRR